MRTANKSIGAAISELRREHGLSQEALAERAGIHRTYVSQLERGIKSPTLTVLAKLAKALNTRPSRLMRSIEGDLD